MGFLYGAHSTVSSLFVVDSGYLQTRYIADWLARKIIQVECGFRRPLTKKLLYFRLKLKKLGKIVSVLKYKILLGYL